MAGVPYTYTNYTSEMLSSGGSETANPFGSFFDENGLGIVPDIPTLPTGKQVIFFTLGIVCIIAAIALIEKTLITEAAPALVTAAKDAIVG